MYTSIKSHHLQKIQELLTFSKQSKELNNLKISEARKIMTYSQFKKQSISNASKTSNKPSNISKTASKN